MDIAIASALLAEWEFDIEVDLEHSNGEVYAAVITTLFDSRSRMTWRPEDAVVAVGLWPVAATRVPRRSVAA